MSLGVSTHWEQKMSPWTHLRYGLGTGTFKGVVSSMKRMDLKIFVYQHREIKTFNNLGSEVGAKESLMAILNCGSLTHAYDLKTKQQQQKPFHLWSGVPKLRK